MKYEAPEEKIMWKDRKRHMGIPLSFTRYECTPARLTISTGLFTTKLEETLLYRVLDTRLTRSFWQKLCGVGTVQVFTGDRSESTITLVNIKGAEKVRRLIGKLVEEERMAKGITAREMYGTGFGQGNNDLDGDGIPDSFQ